MHNLNSTYKVVAHMSLNLPPLFSLVRKDGCFLTSGAGHTKHKQGRMFWQNMALDYRDIFCGPISVGVVGQGLFV